MTLKIEREEDRQLPRWVYALMAAKADPNDADAYDDSPKLRYESKVKAENFYRQRQERMKEMSEQSSRISGLEWKFKPKNTFTSEELDKIIPTRRMSYILHRMIRIIVVMSCVTVATGGTAIIVASVCAEIKLGGNFSQASYAFKTSPMGYLKRVHDVLTQPDNQ
jgi:hypothetical protein